MPDPSPRARNSLAALEISTTARRPVTNSVGERVGNSKRRRWPFRKTRNNRRKRRKIPISIHGAWLHSFRLYRFYGEQRRTSHGQKSRASLPGGTRLVIFIVARIEHGLAFPPPARRGEPSMENRKVKHTLHTNELCNSSRRDKSSSFLPKRRSNFA